MIVIACALGRQGRARAGYRRTRAVNRHGNGAAGEVRDAPTGYVGRYPEAIGSRRIEVAGVSSRRNCCTGTT
jgi:hypothetical protein